MSEITIYGLVCPLENKVMYVGKASQAQWRLEEHLSEARCGGQSPKCDWLRRLISLGLTPSIQVLEVCERPVWTHREKHWIEYHKKLNPDLKNVALSRPVKEFKTESVTVMRLRELATEKGHNQDSIHIATGLPFAVILRYWESSIKQINIDVLNIFCELLNCDVCDLIKRIPTVTTTTQESHP